MLDYKRDATQRLIHETVKASKHDTHFLLCSRRLGKTFELLLEAFELAIQKPNARILYLMPHAKDATTVVSDVLSFILPDCPKDVFNLEDDYKKQEKEFHFKNGSIIRLKGTNGEHSQFLRGGHADLIILDECGLMDDLKHVYMDVVMPMTMTTDGRVLFATTPARSPGHESTMIYNDLADRGAVNVFTIRDNTRVSDEKKIKFLVAAGEKEEHARKVILEGAEPTTTTAKREYFCQFVTDADSAVLPAFDEEARAAIIQDWVRPPFFDTYVCMDPGFIDKTGILFGYWDFAKGKLVIEDESLLHRAGIADIAKEIKVKEQALWVDKKPLLRITDIDPRLVNDLWVHFGLTLVKANKTDSKSAIEEMNRMISMREIIILPKCVNLIRQMQNAIYDSSGKDMERDPVDSHWDLLAALKYLVRGINRSKNPYPEWYTRLPSHQFQNTARRGLPALGLFDNTPLGRKLARSQAKKKY